MLTGFTPPAIKREKPERSTVKQETPTKRQPVIKREPMGPDTPWAMQAVTVQTGPTEEPKLLRVEPVHKPKEHNPWETETKKEKGPDLYPYPLPPGHPHAPPAWDQRPREPPTPARKDRPTLQKQSPSPPRKHVSSRNYAAVEAGLERFGLIDEGPQNAGRALLIHVRKRCRPPFLLLNAVRPGTVLHVRRKGQTGLTLLRIRSTTPARYYSPGAQVTTLSVLVDEADWRSLAADASRI